MLADGVRTSAYQNSVLNNSKDFEGKVILDVGTGTGKSYVLIACEIQVLLNNKMFL